MVEQVKLYWTVPRNRMIVLGLLGMFLCLVMLTFFDENDTAEELPAPQIELQKPPPKKGKFMQEFAVTSPMEQLRDPFSPIHESSQKGKDALPRHSAPTPAATAALDSAKTINAAERSVKPRLAGIIGDENGRIALLEYQSESRACGEGEMIGPYRVTRILNAAAVLDGRAESFSLQVSR